MGPRPLFKVAGIPVSFDPFFLLGAFLVYSWVGGGREGLITVAAMVVFVVIHELGHALTARHFGADVAVNVTFLGGYASFRPTAALTTRHHVLISLAGPLTQFVAALPCMWGVLYLFNHAESAADASLAADLYGAVSWAGILLVFVNLVPLYPLDGGHIADRLIRKAFGDRAQQPYLIASIGVAGVMVLAYAAGTAEVARFWDGIVGTPGFDGTLPTAVLAELRTLPSMLFGQTIFIPLFVALGCWGRLQQLRRFESAVQVTNAPSARELAHDDAVRQATRAERESWIGTSLAAFPRHWEPSPWVSAHQRMVHGDVDGAVDCLARLADDDRRWLLDRADRPEIGHLLAYVPEVARHSRAVLEARVHHGPAEELVAEATRHFGDERSADPLYLGAAGLAERGETDAAIAWLQKAVAVGPDPHRIATAREFRSLHGRSDFQQLLGEAERAAGPLR